MSKSNKEIRDLLTEAVRLIEAPNKWISGSVNLAEDIHGHPCNPVADNAVRFAPMGAVHRAVHNLQLPKQSAFDAAFVLQKVVVIRLPDDAEDEGLGYYNDYASHADIIMLFHEAIDSL